MTYVTSVARLSEAAGYMGLDGVQAHLRQRARKSVHLDADDADERVLVRPFFTDWAALLETHLRDATSPAPVEALLRHFGGGWVPLPLEGEALAALRANSRPPPASAPRSTRARTPRPKRSTAADLTLEFRQ